MIVLQFLCATAPSAKCILAIV